MSPLPAVLAIWVTLLTIIAGSSGRCHQLLFNAPSARLKAGNRKTYGCNIAPARTCRREKAFAARDRGSGGRDQCLRFVAAGVVILFSLAPLFAGRGKASRAYGSIAL